MECPNRTGYVLVTGGTTGVERLAEALGKKYGFQIEVKIGQHHPKAKEIMPLTQETLVRAEPFLQRANQTLKRYLPVYTPPSEKTRCFGSCYIRELLQRYYYIIKDARVVYAFGELTNSHTQVKGGTGWSVQLALNANKEVYVYDTTSNTWYQPFYYRWNDEGRWTKEFGFQPVGGYPTLHKSSAIVGSGCVDEVTRKQVEDFFRRTLCLAKDIEIMNTAFAKMNIDVDDDE